MRAFFRGWRRKTGLVTLVLACMLMTGWVRSQRAQEGICFSIGPDSMTTLYSMHNAFGWGTYHREGDYNLPVFPEWNTIHDETNPLFTSDRMPWSWCGFCVWTPSPYETAWFAPYGPVTIIVTLLSGYLLLGKPRQPNPTPDASNISHLDATQLLESSSPTASTSETRLLYSSASELDGG